MTRRLKFRDDRGQSFVEFVLVLPVLLLILFAIMQMGIVFHNYITITDSVREGARVAAVSRHYTDREAKTIARVRISSQNLDLAKLGVSVTSTWEPGSDVTVTATYPYSIDILGVAVKSGSLTSATTERVE